MHFRSALGYKRSARLSHATVAKIKSTMRLWIVGLFFYLAAIHRIDCRTFPGFASSRPGGEPAPFAEGIRDWFRGVKNRLLGGGGGSSGGSDALPPAEAGRLMMELEREDPQERQERQRNNPGGFFLDLTNLTFDPDRDWGFRLGQWYFIRKVNDAPAPPTDWKSASYPDWPTMVEEKGDNDDFPPLPDIATIESIDVTPDRSTTDATIDDRESTEVTDVPEVPAEKKEADNETRGSPESVQSAEVLIPSE